MRNKLVLPLLIAAASFMFTIFFNEMNLRCIREANPSNSTKNTASIFPGSMVYSVDNEYYVTPAENYISKGKWMRSPAVSKGDNFRRVPGYSILYFIFISALGHVKGLTFLKIFQVLLFGISVFFMFRLIELLTGKRKHALFFSLLYGLTPMFSGWVYFTMTESITPSLTVLFLYFIIKAFREISSKQKYPDYVIASLFAGMLILTRPYTLLFLAVPFFLFFFEEKKNITLFVLPYVLPALMIGAWTIRNHHVSGEIVPLEKAFHPQSLDRMKPDFEGMFTFAKCWGVDGPEFNDFHQPLFHGALNGDTSSQRVTEVLDKWPKDIVNEFGYDKLFRIVRAHQLSVYAMKPYFDKNIALPGAYLPQQLAVKQQYMELVKEFRSKHAFRYWVRSPLIYLKRMVFHSNTSNIMLFQNRNNLPVNIGRYLMLALHVMMYLFVFINLLFARERIYSVLFGIVPLLFIGFFCVVHREIEQRYMLPALPLMFVGMAWMMSGMIEKLGPKKA